jgi:hypothetical protein
VTFVQRATESAKTGVPFGVAINTAQATSDPEQAKGASLLMTPAAGVQGQGGTQTWEQFTANTTPQKQEPVAPFRSAWDHPATVFNDLTTGFVDGDKGFWDNVGSAWSHSWHFGADAIMAPIYYTGRAVKTLDRVAVMAEEKRKKNGALFAFGDLDDWNRAWNDSASGTIGQHVWETFDQSGKSYDEHFARIDDPAANQAFFSNDEGSLAARNFTGAIDFFSNIFMDPTIVGGKASGATRTARQILSAEETARVADLTVPVASLGTRAKLARNSGNQIIDSFLEARAGSASAASQTEYFARNAHGEAAAWLMQHSLQDSVLATAPRPVQRQALWDVLGAMGGDARSIDNLRVTNNRLALEVETLRKDPLDFDIAATLHPDLPAEEWAARVTAAAEGGGDASLFEREVQHYTDILESRVAAGDQVAESAAPGMRVPSKKDVQRITGQGGFKNKIADGRFMRPLNIASGSATVNVVSLSDPTVTTKAIAESIDRASAAYRGLTVDSVNAAGEVSSVPVRQHLLGLRDRLLNPVGGAAGRPEREAVIRELNDTLADMTAKKWGVDRDVFMHLATKAGERKSAMANQMIDRVYKARTAGQHHAFMADPHALTALDMTSPQAADLVRIAEAKQAAVAAEKSPVLRSQQQDLVALLDPRELDRLARLTVGHAPSAKAVQRKVNKGKMSVSDLTPEARMMIGAERADKIAGMQHAISTVLASTTNLWKFASLFRLAYPIRIQVDTQARLLATLNPLRYGLSAMEGTKNWAYNNLHRISEAGQVDLGERFMATVKRQELNDALRDVDMAQVGRVRVSEERLAKYESLSRRERIDTLRDELYPRLPNGRRKPLSAQQKADIEAQADAAHAERITQARGQLEKERVSLGSLTPDDIARMRSELRLAQQRLEQPLAVGGKKVRFGGTDYARHIGNAYRIDPKTGQVTLFKGDKAALLPFKSPEQRLSELRRISAENSNLNMFTSRTMWETNVARSTGQASQPWHHLTGKDAGWLEALQRDLRQASQDALGRRLLRGDPEEAAEKALHWLDNTPEGRQYLRDMRKYSTEDVDAAALVQNAMEHLETLAPIGSPIRARAATGSYRVNKNEVDATWTDPTSRPVIPGQDVAPRNFLTGARAQANRLREGWFNWASTMPENVLGRHPFFVERYRHHAMQMIGQRGGGRLTAAELDKIRKQAAAQSRHDLGRTLFDVSHQSNIAEQMRFISPFYSAWADTMRKWSRIFAEDPGNLALMAKVPTAPRAAGLVTDDDGNFVGPDGRVYGDDGQVIKNPDGTSKRIGIFEGNISLPGLPKWLQEKTGQENFIFSAQSANVIFQGEPFWLPGNGPLVTVAASQIVKQSYGTWFPEEDDTSFSASVMRYLLPYGPEYNPLEASMPTWAKSVRDLMGGTATRNGRLTYAELYANQRIAEEQGQTEPLTEAERVEKINNQTRNSLFMRVLGTWAAPVSLQNNSPLDYYRKRLRQNISELGYEAGQDKFLADYPEYLDLTIGLTANETGLVANDETAEQMKRHRNEMDANPDLAFVWAGAATLAPGFNQAVYDYQGSEAVGPFSAVTFRGTKAPAEVARDINVTQGWQQFTAMNTALTTRMRDLGLTSLQQSGAADLAAYKARWLDGMQQSNPDWYDKYTTQNTVAKAQEIVAYVWQNAPKMKGDPMLGYDAWAEYFTVRQMFQQRMAELGIASLSSQAAGGKDRDAPEGLTLAWDQAMEDLAARSPAFNVAWNRGLGSDDLSGNVYDMTGGE